MERLFENVKIGAHPISSIRRRKRAIPVLNWDVNFRKIQML